MDFVRYRDGKVVEHWSIVDVAGLMRQLGAAQ
jgi:predicted ester cyclase